MATRWEMLIIYIKQFPSQLLFRLIMALRTLDRFLSRFHSITRSDLTQKQLVLLEEVDTCNKLALEVISFGKPSQSEIYTKHADEIREYLIKEALKLNNITNT